MDKLNIITVIITVFALMGCNQTIVDYSIKNPELTSNMITETQEQAVFAIQDIERVLTSGQLDVKTPVDLSTQETAQFLFNNSKKGLGDEVKSILYHELVTRLKYTVQILYNSNAYIADKILFCNDLLSNSLSLNEITIRNFACDRILADQTFNFANADLFTTSLPLQNGAKFNVRTLEAYPILPLEWYIFNENGIHPIDLQVDQVTVNNVSTTNIIFVRAESDYKSPAKIFIWEVKQQKI